MHGLDHALDIAAETGCTPRQVNGEPAVWAAQQRGVPAFCLTVGERAHTAARRLGPDLASRLDERGLAKCIDVCLDCDAAGIEGALHMAPAWTAGISVRLLDLRSSPFDLPDNGDVGDLVLAAGDRLAIAVAALVELEPRGEPNLGNRSVLSESTIRADDPVIEVHDRQLRDVSNDALAAIVAANDPPVVFRRSDGLVRVVNDDEGRSIIQTYGRTRCEAASRASLRGNAARARRKCRRGLATKRGR